MSSSGATDPENGYTLYLPRLLRESRASVVAFCVSMEQFGAGTLMLRTDPKRAEIEAVYCAERWHALMRGFQL